MTIAAGVTPIFWVYVVFVIALLVSCAWLMTTPGQSAVPAGPMSPWMPPWARPLMAACGRAARRTRTQRPRRRSDRRRRRGRTRPTQPTGAAAPHDAGAGDDEHSAYA